MTVILQTESPFLVKMHYFTQQRPFNEWGCWLDPQLGSTFITDESDWMVKFTRVSCNPQNSIIRWWEKKKKKVFYHSKDSASDNYVHVVKSAWGLAFQQQRLHVSCIKLCQQKATSGRPLCSPLQEILWLKPAVDKLKRRWPHREQMKNSFWVF